MRAFTKWAGAIFLLVYGVTGFAQARPTTSLGAAIEGGVSERTVNDWLMRMHEASRKRAYVGTFVVSAGGGMSSARIWHVCDGDQQMERVESLTGPPKSTFRRNDQVVTFLPETHVAVVERRESLGLFPNLLQTPEASLAQYYQVKVTGTERVAGYDADVVHLRAEDNLRFGYRVWTERKSGLVVKLQTLDSTGLVLEQAAFFELQLDAPVSMAKLSQMMGNTTGYQMVRPEMVKTTALAEGWGLKAAVPGFKPMSCYKRLAGSPVAPNAEGTLQWVFSDGLATVSLFVEPFDANRHGKPANLAFGATHTLTRRLGDWWLTAVGEVPAQTLLAFAQGLERKK
jgi:sigma-E factor negative regulatory protein RseB